MVEKVINSNPHHPNAAETFTAHGLKFSNAQINALYSVGLGVGG